MFRYETGETYAHAFFIVYNPKPRAKKTTKALISLSYKKNFKVKKDSITTDLYSLHFMVLLQLRFVCTLL